MWEQFWENLTTEPWFEDVSIWPFKQIKVRTSSAVLDCIEFWWKTLKKSYQNNDEKLWIVKILRIEKYDFYNIAVIKIHHNYPPKEYWASWNRYNPRTWRYDWESIKYKRKSKWRVKKKSYRVQYTPWKIWEWNYWIFCFGWEVKDWKKADLNEESIRSILEEVESLAES